MMKVCVTCNLEKAFEAFHKNRGYSDGLHKQCKECRKEYSARHYKERKDEVSQRAKQRYERNRDRVIASVAAYTEANRDKVSSAQSRYYRSHKAQRQAYRKQHYEQNKETYIVNTKARQALARGATPIWANPEEIKRLYAEARRITRETGVVHHVDHIVPLKGRTVTGLHVEYNLQIIPACENFSKSNKVLEL